MATIPLKLKRQLEKRKIKNQSQFIEKAIEKALAS